MKLALRMVEVTVVVLAAVISVWAQSADELKSKYGPSFEAFEVRPGIMMTVRFDENGQASEYRVERHASTDSKIFLDAAIPSNLAKEIVDELVPVAQRGRRGEFSDLTLIVGGGGTSTDAYDSVAITYYSNQTKECTGLMAIVIKWKNRSAIK